MSNNVYQMIVRAQADAGSAIRGHGALTVGSYQHRDRACGLGRPDGADLHSGGFQVGHQPFAELVIADPGDQANGLTQRSGPRAEVGGLTSAAHADSGRPIVIRAERTIRDDRDVEQQVSDG